MRLVLALIALGIVTAVPAKVNAQSWQEYRPDGGGFRVEMPGTPKLETKQSKNGNPDYYATVAFKKMAFLACTARSMTAIPPSRNFRWMPWCKE